ncbi:hypothetical protein N7462_003460 [Penicillium macrosclerotiorum]|uniref:uncharacterized protein n=1 Tax=Penicillium macrosclerotiorum TaxID=303699 RepID=UPI002546F79B|nr:uncharacterized protein N7462_003460 [Penicillium macrosclerotiorum]KAJ5689068.1 hypothetical protein N7462_003460 [Penicillium macrosclerotiorum]
MERKLSQKAQKMRQRFSFRGRTRAATLTAPSTSTTTLNHRPRSATTSVSQPDWDSVDTLRCYQFIDEPGYFRPVSPILDRQTLEEDMEDDLKHACSLLVQSIDRGLPVWPSAQPSHPDPHPFSLYRYQGASLSPRALDLATPATPPSPLTHPNAASVPGARFYGTRLSTSPLEEDENEPRGRSRSRSVSSIGTTPRSRSFSPEMFPYSPPLAHAPWASADILFADQDPEDHPLGPKAQDWLSATMDVDTPIKPVVSVAPRRFYSTRQRHKRVSRAHSRTPSLYGSRASVSSDEADRPDFDVRLWSGPERAFYSVAGPGEPRKRKRRASHLWRKLAGLGGRRRVD